MHESSTGRRSLAVKLALLGAGVAAGGITATAIAADATTIGSGSTATSTSTTASTTSSNGPSDGPSDGPSNGQQPRANQHGSTPVRSDEKSVDAATAAKLKAAALKAVAGGTVYRVETDSGDATYEAHMTKSDGTDVTVKFDKSLKVTGVESGMGK
jgi:hypothetical protein